MMNPLLSETRPDNMPLRVAGLLACTMLIILLSLNPFSGWRMPSHGIWDFIWQPMPKYWTKFDVLVNVLAYIPLGFLSASSVMLKCHRVVAFIVSVIYAVALSGCLEMLQGFLPSRVSSNLDLICNSIGGFLGAAIACYFKRALLEKGLLLSIRREWFQENSGFGLILVVLWGLTQFQPQMYVFTNGDWVSLIARGVERIFGMVIPQFWQPLTSEQYDIIETVIIACQFTAAGLVFGSLMRSRAPRQVLLVLWFCGAIFCKIVFHQQMLHDTVWFAWLSSEALTGLILSSIILFALSFVPRRIMLRMGFLLLLIGLFSLNILPNNPDEVYAQKIWNPGHWLNFNGLIRVLDWVWPILALNYYMRHISWHMDFPPPDKPLSDN